MPHLAKTLAAAAVLFVAAPAWADVAPSRCDCHAAGAPASNDAPVLASLLLGAAVAGAGWRLRKR